MAMNPMYAFFPYTWDKSSSKPPPNPYTTGKASEEKDLKQLWEKSGDTQYSTMGACAAADRLFEYGSYKTNPSMRTVPALESYFGKPADLKDETSLTYVLHTPEAEQCYKLILGKDGFYYRKDSIRTKAHVGSKP